MGSNYRSSPNSTIGPHRPRSHLVPTVRGCIVLWQSARSTSAFDDASRIGAASVFILSSAPRTVVTLAKTVRTLLDPVFRTQSASVHDSRHCGAHAPLRPRYRRAHVSVVDQVVRDREQRGHDPTFHPATHRHPPGQTMRFLEIITASEHGIKNILIPVGWLSRNRGGDQRGASK